MGMQSSTDIDSDGYKSITRKRSMSTRKSYCEDESKSETASKECKTITKTTMTTQTEINVSKENDTNNQKKGLDYSDDWMIDDVGAIESSDEEGNETEEVNEKETLI